MNGNLVFADVVLENHMRSSALIDEGCQCYAAINKSLVQKLGLSYVCHGTREVRGASKSMTNSTIEGVVGL